MKKDFYIDMIMGEWKKDKKKTTKDNMAWSRKATVKLHKDNAMEWMDPTDFIVHKVHGDVVLTETKLVNLATSQQTFFRGLELTKDSVKVPKVM